MKSIRGTMKDFIPIHCAYGAIALFISLLNNIFLLFYVDTFVSIYKIDQASFWVGETIFLIWNSVNDPLFGWMSDRKSLSSSSDSHKGSSGVDIVLKRIRALSRYGPLFALSFLSFWFPLIPPAFQFVACLCAYDAFLTMVDLHHQALLADVAIKSTDRAKLNSFCSIFSAVGSLSVFLSYIVWNKHDLIYFRLLCTVCAVFVAFGFKLSCSVLEENFSGPKHPQALEDKWEVDIKIGRSVGKETLSAQQYVIQLVKHKNFMWFAVMNVVQVFHCHFNSNFFPLFIEHLLGHVVTPRMGALLLGLSFLVPHINNLYFLSLCRKYGAYIVIRGLFIVKLLLALVMWKLGMDWRVFLCLFIASNRVFTEGTCKLLNLVISDLVDEDLVLNHRKEAVSALVFGMSALLSKPGQTIAPLFGTWLLYKETGRSVFFEKGGITTVSAADIFFKQGCFNVLVFVPIACAIVQLIVWSRFKLHGRRLAYIKSARAGIEPGFNIFV